MGLSAVRPPSGAGRLVFGVLLACCGLAAACSSGGAKRSASKGQPHATAEPASAEADPCDTSGDEGSDSGLTLDDSANDDGASEESPSADPCAVATQEPVATATPEAVGEEDLLEGLLNSQARKDCNAGGHAYFHEKELPDHPLGYCESDVTYPAGFECTKAGVIAAFGGGATITAALNTAEAELYTIDQCGTKAGKPVVYLVCYTNNQPGDEGCKLKAQITSDQPGVLARRITF